MVFVCLILRILTVARQQMHNLNQGHGDPQGIIIVCHREKFYRHSYNSLGYTQSEDCIENFYTENNIYV